MHWRKRPYWLRRCVSACGAQGRRRRASIRPIWRWAASARARRKRSCTGGTDRRKRSCGIFRGAGSACAGIQLRRFLFVLVTEVDHRVRWAMAQDTPNAMTTPEGIGIGSSLNSVLGAYGAPDLRQIDGEVDYLWYFSDDGSPSRLVFCVSYSKVVGITCGSR